MAYQLWHVSYGILVMALRQPLPRLLQLTIPQRARGRAGHRWAARPLAIEPACLAWSVWCRRALYLHASTLAARAATSCATAALPHMLRRDRTAVLRRDRSALRSALQAGRALAVPPSIPCEHISYGICSYGILVLAY